MKAKWLFDEHPILVDRELASVIGLNESIILQQLNYWLHSKSAKQINGRLWVYNTYDNWRKDNFPFWSKNTIRRAFDSCIKRGLIITGNFNKAGFDKTKWYSIDIKKLDEVMVSASAQNGQTSGPKWADGSAQNGQTSGPKWADGSAQNGQTSGPKWADGSAQDGHTNTRYYTETKADTTTEKDKGTAQPAMTLAAQRREVIKYLNEVTGKKFKPNADGNKRVIDPRLKEGYTVADLKHIIDIKYAEWHGKTFSNGKPGDFYMRPETLFRVSKIESYRTEEIHEKATAQGETGDPLYDDPWFKH